MKKTVFLIIPFLFVMCTNSNQNAKQISMQNDSLQRLVIEKDSAIYAFMNTFNSIENNLQTIKEKENIISLNSSDNEAKQNDINDDIQMIYDLMLQNKDKVAKLEQQLKRAGVSNNNLQATITNLKIKLQDKDAEILRMREELKDLNYHVDELYYTIDTLEFINYEREQIIASQSDELHTAYYLFGSKKELKDADVIDTKGLFSGSKNINKNFDKSLFTKIDTRTDTVFVMNTKSIKILSVHPESSFKIVGEKPVENITITNPDEFWSVSKYLVVIIN